MPLRIRGNRADLEFIADHFDLAGLLLSSMGKSSGCLIEGSVRADVGDPLPPVTVPPIQSQPGPQRVEGLDDTVISGLVAGHADLDDGPRHGSVVGEPDDGLSHVLVVGELGCSEIGSESLLDVVGVMGRTWP